MPTVITTEEIISATLGLELNGRPISGAISPQIAFLSSNPAVLGVKNDAMPNTIDLQAVALGSANLTISADCTFADPASRGNITQTKSKTLSIEVVESSGNLSLIIN